MPSSLVFSNGKYRCFSSLQQKRQNEVPTQQHSTSESDSVVLQHSEKKRRSRSKKIVLGMLGFTLFGFVTMLISIGFALKWIASMTYGDFLRRAFNFFDDDGDGVVRVEDLQSKWSMKLKEVTTECSDNVCDDAFKLFWSRLAPAVEKCLADCNNPINIYDFNDLVAGVLFTVVDVDANEYITEADIRAISDAFPERDGDIDQLIEWIMRECDLDNDGRISLRDVQFRLRTELEADDVSFLGY